MPDGDGGAGRVSWHGPWVNGNLLVLGGGEYVPSLDPGPDVGPTSVVLHKPKKERSSSLALCALQGVVSQDKALEGKKRGHHP
jgi:hypothetical protein